MMAFSTLIIMLSGVPIAFALGIVAVGSILLFLDLSVFDLTAEFVYGSLDNFALLAIPLFVYMGAVFAGSRAGTEVFSTAQKWLGRLPGGLAISSVVASALFAALSGSSAATAAAVGKIAIPEMKKRGYSNQVASGAIAAGGTLGILIPPSVTLILYGIAVEQSIGKLFMGGIIPGIVVTFLFCLWIFIAVQREKKTMSLKATDETPYLPTFSWSERFMSFFHVLPFLLIIAGVLASLYLGLATPSEGAAVGAILSVVMVIVIYRSMTWNKMMSMLLEATKESTMILLIIAFSALIGTVLSFLSVPQDLANYITQLDVSKWVIMIFINIFLLILGCFLLPVAIVMMTSPILFPIITGLGFDPIWFGIVMTINMEMGLITPPVGMNLFVVKGIAPDIPTGDILKGAIPYVAVLGVAIVIFSIFPGIVTWLPNLLIK